MNPQKIVVFGAGKIGRSFIGQIFGRSGWEVVFVDIDERLIELLNRRGEYRVVIRDGERSEELDIAGVGGYRLGDTDDVARQVADAGMVAFAVGQQGLPAAVSALAKGLLLRRQRHGDLPLDVIIAENMRNADAAIRTELAALLPGDYPLDRLVGPVETSIGKMVPIIPLKDMEEDPLRVFAEPYNTLIVARDGFRNPIPEISFLAPKENIKAWVDRKLFIHNLGHAALAYLGYRAHPERTYIWQMLEDGDLSRLVRRTMIEAADILRALYPGEFTAAGLEEHIDDLLRRFGNRGLGDTVFRVGCDLYRKLGPEDRLAAPVHAARRMNKPSGLIVDAIVAAISFRATDENGRFHPADGSFFEEAEKGADHIMENICKLKLFAR
jgi:mannitol-1-phosphate 5-dehydrogenase